MSRIDLNAHQAQLAADLRAWQRETADVLNDLIKVQDEIAAARPLPGSDKDRALQARLYHCEQHFQAVDQARANIEQALQRVTSMISQGGGAPRRFPAPAPTPAQLKARDIFVAGFALLRTIAPTLPGHLYGDAGEVLGCHDPRQWNPVEVEALLNVIGHLSNGLENFGDLVAADNPVALERDTAWIVERMERIAVPERVLGMAVWQRFCEVIGRPLGNPLAVQATA
ncbi:hypothetical protein [Azospirillum sp. sgz302134]